MRPRSKQRWAGMLLTLAALTGLQAVWVPAVAWATDWVKLPPAQVVSQSELVAVGRFEAPPAVEKPRLVWADGVVWEARPFAVEFYLRQQGVLRRLEIGVEPADAARITGRRYLVLLKQQAGGWVPVVGPNGLVPLAEPSLAATGGGQNERVEPLLAEAADREFYRRLLAEQPRFAPFGAGREPGDGTDRVAASLYVVAAAALVLILGNAMRARRRRAAEMQRRQP